ncbi:MAG: Crp/Fnr family transcriptional regulator [Sulfurovum sp.]|nr:Crp/Fnr family transcriptional regulator [Sulfurovum sp.]
MYELKDIPLFSGLSELHLAELQEHIYVKHYSKDSIVFYEEDKSEYLHVLLEGDVKLYKTTPNGKEVYLHGMSAPNAIALFPALERVAFPATCAFLTEGTVGLLPLEKLHKCLENLDFSLAMIKAMSKRMKLLENLLHKETIFSSEAKIADLIANNAKIFQHLRNNEIASILNITPETLSRILTKLKKEEIITIDDHIVTIVNQNALQDIIETNSMKKSASN